MSLNNEVRLIGNVVKDPEVFDSEKGKLGKVRTIVVFYQFSHGIG